MMKQARCFVAWTPCHPSLGATSMRITAGFSRSSVNGRNSSARQQPHRGSPQRLWSPHILVQMMSSKYLLSQHLSQDPPLKSRTRELLQSHNQIQKQRKILSLNPERSLKVCGGCYTVYPASKSNFSVQTCMLIHSLISSLFSDPRRI